MQTILANDEKTYLVFYNTRLPPTSSPRARRHGRPVPVAHPGGLVARVEEGAVGAPRDLLEEAGETAVLLRGTGAQCARHHQQGRPDVAALREKRLLGERVHRLPGGAVVRRATHLVAVRAGGGGGKSVFAPGPVSCMVAGISGSGCGPRRRNWK